MKAYQTDSDGVFVAEIELRKDPRDPERHLLPRGAVTTPPPKFSAKRIPVFKNGAWLVVEDHRGETWYDSERGSVSIDSVGDPRDAGLVAKLEDLPPPKKPEDPNAVKEYPTKTEAMDKAAPSHFFVVNAGQAAGVYLNRAAGAVKVADLS